MLRRSVVQPVLFLVIVGVSAVGSVRELAAQGLRDVRYGERVRVTRRDSSVVIGEVLANRRDTLTLQSAQRDAVTPLAYRDVALFERAISTDYEAGARRGFRAGGIVGLAVVGVALYLDVRPKEGLRMPVRTILAIPMAAGLAFLGRAVGAGAVTDEWGVPQRVIVVAQPNDARQPALGVGVEVRW
jgi:hypothetical protein